jgi:phosphoglycerate kinase
VLGELRTIDDVDVEDRRVLLRADFDVPLIQAPAGAPVRVADDARIQAALATIHELRLRGARLVIISGLGRPQGHDPALSMRPVADHLAKLTGDPVVLAPAVTGRHARDLTERLAPGQVLMLENVRFEPGEMDNDPRLASALAELADLYVNDDFGSTHRAHASTEGIAHRLPCAAGRLLAREVGALNAIAYAPERPLVTILGGAKLGGKIALVRRFLELADAVCIGGGMCFPFLAAQGHSVGSSLCPHEDLEPARVALTAAGPGCRLELPRDLLLAKRDDEESMPVRVLDGADVPDGWMGLDIGPATADRYAAEIAAAATVFWYGPMGRIELAPFAAGTHAIAGAIASTPAVTVAGGGETAMAVRSFGLRHHVSHLSSGGAATLEFLAGRELPGVQALRRGRGAMSLPSGRPCARRGI